MGAGSWASWCRRPVARRRASRIVSGRGTQPANRPSSTIGGAIGLEAMICAGVPDLDRGAVPREVHDPVGEGDDALQAVLGQDDGQAEVMHEPVQRRQHLLGCRWVQRGGRLVQHEHGRVGGQHRADRDPLTFSAGQGVQRAGTELDESEQVQGLLDPAAHDVRCQPERLHPVGQLVLHQVRDETGSGDPGPPRRPGPRALAVDGSRCRDRRRSPVRAGCHP
jgi:hypothetical protein